MSITRIQKGDNVKVISGKYRNTEGVVSAVRKLQNGKLRVAVAGIEKISKFQKANKQYSLPGSIKQIDRFIDASNVSLLDDKGKISKVSIDEKDGKKFRVYKTTGKQVKKTTVSTNENDTKIAKKKVSKEKTKKSTK